MDDMDAPVCPDSKEGVAGAVHVVHRGPCRPLDGAAITRHVSRISVVRPLRISGVDPLRVLERLEGVRVRRP